MNVEDSLLSVSTELDELWDQISAILDSEDRVAQVRTILSGIELAKKYEQVKANAIAVIARFLDPAEAISPEKRLEWLSHGFAVAAKLGAAFHDEMSDVETETKLVKQMAAIARALEACGGPLALVGLLDDADARVRASAGAYLLLKGLAPDRVVPVLRQIETDEQANSAHFVATWALFRWEIEGKTGLQT